MRIERVDTGLDEPRIEIDFCGEEVFGGSIDPPWAVMFGIAERKIKELEAKVDGLEQDVHELRLGGT